MNNIINVRGLTACYENRPIFTNLDFSVEDGDLLYIVGENGSGKTTLMRCLLGLKVKYTGSIEFYKISRKDIGYLPQKAVSHSDFPASVFEVVSSGIAGRGFFGLPLTKAKRRKIYEKLKEFEISDLAERPYNALSGGQQQKVLICRALCATEKVILLDEPATALDTAAKEELYRLIETLNEKGITVIVISHDIDRAVKCAKHILHISDNDGFFGTPEEYIKSELYEKLRGAQN